MPEDDTDRTSRTLTSVLSVRVRRDLLKELTLAARAVDKAPATLARELIERGIALDYPASSALLGRVLVRLIEQTVVSSPALQIDSVVATSLVSHGSWLSTAGWRGLIGGDDACPKGPQPAWTFFRSTQHNDAIAARIEERTV